MSRYPIVVRLDGNETPRRGARILQEAGKPNIYPEATMLDGAKRAVELAKVTADVWSDRAEQYRTRRDPLGGRGFSISSSSGASRVPASTCSIVATGGGHVARRLRELGAKRRHRRSRTGHAGGRERAGRASAVRRLELRRGRMPVSPLITSPTCSRR